jgi:hypothetical protein
MMRRSSDRRTNWWALGGLALAEHVLGDLEASTDVGAVGEHEVVESAAEFGGGVEHGRGA